MSHANKKRRVTQRTIAFLPSCDFFGADNCDKWNTKMGVSCWSPWSGRRAKEIWLVAFIHFTPTSSLTVQAHCISRETMIISKSNKWWRANTFAGDICVSYSMRCAQWLMDFSSIFWRHGRITGHRVDNTRPKRWPRCTVPSLRITELIISDLNATLSPHLCLPLNCSGHCMWSNVRKKRRKFPLHTPNHYARAWETRYVCCVPVNGNWTPLRILDGGQWICEYNDTEFPYLVDFCKRFPKPNKTIGSSCEKVVNAFRYSVVSVFVFSSHVPGLSLSL